MTTAIDPALTLHQWLSPAFPVGAFAYSHGMESEVAAGRLPDAAAVLSWLDICLTQGSGRNDAILLAAAHRGAADLPRDLADLAEALAPSAERREETMAQGRAFATTINALHGLDLSPMAYPLVVGQAAGRMQLPLGLTLRLFLQAFAGNLVSAAVRLVPLGQTDGQKVLAALAPVIENLAIEAKSGDLDAIGGAALTIDLASMRHERQRTRLFRS
ncbi:urease accessory UreF family protein [Pseudooceanicola sp.]|uniref:urease accessory protein UreF n=1 Tax=Pseudooceanicola sp. TaxID=1914328 RepID=UPI00260AA8EF|nr:urease accessory UreF family protein [Pseudooceanicola sp.]MDF1854805.1 urease accessory UreF family protein [Pseudooceanicola sp.]